MRRRQKVSKQSYSIIYHVGISVVNNNYSSINGSEQSQESFLMLNQYTHITHVQYNKQSRFSTISFCLLNDYILGIWTSCG